MCFPELCDQTGGLALDFTRHARAQVLKRSMGAPLRLTSLVVKQVLSCLATELSQAGIARFRVNSLSLLRVLDSAPIPLDSDRGDFVAPEGIRLVRQAADDDPATLTRAPPPVLETPVGRFATAAALAQCGSAHAAAALVHAHGHALPAQVDVLRRGTPAPAVEAGLLWLHMALTIQGARLLPEAVRDALLAALKVKAVASSCYHVCEVELARAVSHHSGFVLV
jgi:hypothetical protein